MTALFRDIQDLNSMAKEMAIQVDTQQDQIGKCNSFISSVKRSESKQGWDAALHVYSSEFSKD